MKRSVYQGLEHREITVQFFIVVKIIGTLVVDYLYTIWEQNSKLKNCVEKVRIDISRGQHKSKCEMRGQDTNAGELKRIV